MVICTHKSMTSAWEKAGLFWIYFVINMEFSPTEFSAIFKDIFTRLENNMALMPFCAISTNQSILDLILFFFFCLFWVFFSILDLGLHSLSLQDFQEMLYISVTSLMLYWNWRSFSKNPLSPLEGWLLLHCFDLFFAELWLLSFGIWGSM